MGRRAGPQTNKFKQVSSAHHQMSLAGRGKVPRCDVSGGGGHQLPTVADRGGQEGHAPPRDPVKDYLELKVKVIS